MALHKQLKMVTRFVPPYTVRWLTKYYCLSERTWW